MQSSFRDAIRSMHVSKGNLIRQLHISSSLGSFKVRNKRFRIPSFYHYNVVEIYLLLNNLKLSKLDESTLCWHVIIKSFIFISDPSIVRGKN